MTEIVIFADFEIYSLFGSLCWKQSKDLVMKVLMVKIATMKLSPLLQGVMKGDLFFLGKTG